MIRLDKHWNIPPRIPADVDLALQLYPPILRQILYNRGYSTAEQARQFLEARPPAGADPLCMLGIPEAVDRIHHALRKAEPIAVYGDYDADGVTATALLVQTLNELGGDARGYIPNRFEEGYGLNRDALENLQSQGTRLVITVDCGIRSHPEVAYAKQLGLDLIITDHHHPANGELPDALAVVNPKQPGDTYPDKDLAGVGLSYKLAVALLDQMGPAARLEEEDLLDLVALGTVADLAPLTGENRSLVRAGLEYIRHPQRQGILSLIGVAELQPQKVTASDIGFVLAPRLNAAGRLESALAALKLLTSNSPVEAGMLAQQLHIQNRERQRITQEMQADAEQLALQENPDALLLFACRDTYNPGVIGLAASRLTETYYRPAIVACRGEQFTRASCRSIEEFHITDALDECQDLLEHHGGHAAAAGFTVRNENLPALLERLQEIAVRKLSEKQLRPVVKADMEICLSDLKPESIPELLRDLETLQPTGFGNPAALFVSRNLKVFTSRTVGKEDKHLKLTILADRVTYDAIAFNQGHWQSQMPPYVDLLYAFEINEYNGRSSLQLKVRDLKPSEGRGGH